MHTFDELGDSSEEVRVDGLSGGLEVDVVRHAVDDSEDGALDIGGTLLKNFYQEAEHAEGEMGVGVVQILAPC